MAATLRRRRRIPPLLRLLCRAHPPHPRVRCANVPLPSTVGRVSTSVTLASPPALLPRLQGMMESTLTMRESRVGDIGAVENAPPRLRVLEISLMVRVSVQLRSVTLLGMMPQMLEMSQAGVPLLGMRTLPPERCGQTVVQRKRTPTLVRGRALLPRGDRILMPSSIMSTRLWRATMNAWPIFARRARLLASRRTPSAGR